MKQQTGIVDAICPRCGQSVHSESVPGRTVSEVRKFMKQVIQSLKRQYPFAKIKTTDPLESA